MASFRQLLFRKLEAYHAHIFLKRIIVYMLIRKTYKADREKSHKACVIHFFFRSAPRVTRETASRLGYSYVPQHPVCPRSLR
jgi:hypothetical protein